MKKLSIFSAITALVLVLPFVSEAYFTTNQTATRLGNSAAMYTIEYSFGLEDHDIYMPIMAQRGLMPESEDKKAGYTFIKNSDQVQENGTAAGLILSTAPVVDGMYKVAKGTAQKMTLLTFLVTDASDTENDYALQVTKLPYFVDRDGKMQSLQLNPTELQYYVTGEVELNAKQ